MSNILVIGASSAIAQAAARKWAKERHSLFLVARSDDHLQIIADDLVVHGAHLAGVFALDLTHEGQHQRMIDAAIEALGSLDVVLIAHGWTPNQEAVQNNWPLARHVLEVNALSVLSLLTNLAATMEQKQMQGVLAVISSVAGDRGRQSNYVYGSAKALVTTFCQGLRNRLVKSGIYVLTIKPGFVSTPMTQHLPQGPLFVPPEKVADDISKAIDKRKDVLYTPGIWWLIMTIIKAIPEKIFKKLKL